MNIRYYTKPMIDELYASIKKEIESSFPGLISCLSFWSPPQSKIDIRVVVDDRNDFVNIRKVLNAKLKKVLSTLSVKYPEFETPRISIHKVK